MKRTKKGGSFVWRFAHKIYGINGGKKLRKNHQKNQGIDAINEILNRRYRILYESVPAIKNLQGSSFVAQIFECMPVKLSQNEKKEVSARSFCGIDLSRSQPDIVTGLFLTDFIEKKVYELTMPDEKNSKRNIVNIYRAMKLLESIRTIDITGNAYLVGSIVADWKMLSEETKKDIAASLELSVNSIEKIMALYPPDLEKNISILREYNIKTSKTVIQEAVLAGVINVSPELKKQGIKSIEEVARKRKEVKHIIKPYLKYLNSYFGQFKHNCEFANMFADYVSEIIKMNIIQEKDILLGVTLIRLENQVFDIALHSNIDFFPKEIVEEFDISIKGIEAQNKNEVIRKVTAFLVESFPESGRSAEDYSREILDAMDRIEMAGAQKV